jgi:hypothetical protein
VRGSQHEGFAALGTRVRNNLMLMDMLVGLSP